MDLDFSSLNVLVIGDIMLDKYYDGEVSRISPEAPVPVINVKKITDGLGGAANVAHNIVSLKGNSTLIGLTGNDKEKEVLEKLANEKKIKTHFIETNKPTITKSRVVGNSQQITRLDVEEPFNINDTIHRKLINIFEKEIPKADIIIISDYGKGLIIKNIVNDILSISKKSNIKVIIDPKTCDWNIYADSYLIKPNFKEFCDTIGFQIENTDEEIEKYGFKLLDKYNFANILVTRSEKGMSLISKNQCIHTEVDGKEVYDVSGAGDTVAAIIGLTISKNYEFEDIVKLANKGAGIVVSKEGTKPIFHHEIVDKK